VGARDGCLVLPLAKRLGNHCARPRPQYRGQRGPKYGLHVHSQ